MGAILWVLCVQFFVAEQVGARAWATTYSWTANAVSDLGATRCVLDRVPVVCSPLHAWINLSFVLQGVLIALGALLVRPVFPARRGYSVATGLAVLCGAGVICVGLAPEDVAVSVHRLGAGLHFFCGAVLMLVFGGLCFRSLIGVMSLVLGVPAMAATVWLGFGGGVWPLGVVERVVAYAIPLWFMGMGMWVWPRGVQGAGIATADSLRE